MNVKRIMTGFVALLVSVVLGYTLGSGKDFAALQTTFQVRDSGSALYPQAVLYTVDQPMPIQQLYYRDQLIGVISDKAYFDSLLDAVYKANYEEAFPNTKLGMDPDLYIVQQQSFNVYQDIDDQIFEYVHKEGLVAIEVNKVSFSNGAVIYVKNLEDFTNARREFILGYISEEAYNSLINNERIVPLQTYGSQEVGFEVLESIIVSKDVATIEDIYLDTTSILNFLSFGYSPDIESYTVQDFDTIEGIAWLNQMSPNQLVSINHDVLSDVNQVIKPGLNLNVARFNSPLTVRVMKERMVSESVYPASTIYREDPSLREGLRRVEQHEVIGSENVVYLDVYENDIAISSTRQSSTITKEPVQEIVYIGTYEEPKVGSGVLRWPMNNARVSCGWYCYGGHTAIDIQARSNRGYGPIYAADRGVVVLNQYHYGYGYYLIINHNNGMKTTYAHMESPGYFPVGTTVKRGEQIGYVGMTGRTTGPHLHFEVIVNGSKVNPCRYLGC